jgi:hypothetical protein
MYRMCDSNSNRIFIYGGPYNHDQYPDFNRLTSVNNLSNGDGAAVYVDNGGFYVDADSSRYCSRYGYTEEWPSEFSSFDPHSYLNHAG